LIASLERAVAADSSLEALAQAAFTAFLRAYAVHSKELKPVSWRALGLLICSLSSSLLESPSLEVYYYLIKLF
jgi:hypothetical protein